MARHFRVLGLVGVVLLRASAVGAHGAPVGPGPYMFVLDLAGTPLDEFPTGVKALNGVMTVVDKGGQHMLMASSPSELLITLPQVLPPVFTVEVDLVPKACCNPDDFMLEGTPIRNRGAASAELTWHPERISAVGGGGEMYQSAVPADLAAAAPGNLTHLVFEINGTTIKLWTNGRRLYTLDKQFVRGRVLRVWLGGESATNPMYLAGLRVGTGPASAGVIAAGAGMPGGGAATLNPSSQPGPQTVGTQQAASGGGRVVPNVAVTMGSGGPLVTWGLLGGVTSYSVKRWKLNDLTCCNAVSPALSGPPWQDVALTVAGTYVYEVTAMNPGWTATGQAQFVQFKSSGQIATVAPSGSTAPANPAATSGVPTVSSSSAAPPNSAISRILPPPPRVIAVNGINGTGPYGTVPPKTLVLSTLAGSGGFGGIAPRTLALASITAVGVGIRTIRPLPGTTTTTTLIPTPRTISLAGISAVGGTSAVPPRTITLAPTTAAGRFWVPLPRAFSLVGWTAAGIYP